MKRVLLSIFTATSLLLFIAANALSYVYVQKESAISMFEQASDDTEESENQENENKSTEVEDDDNLFLIGHGLPLSWYPKGAHTYYFSHYEQGHQLEINPPPPQF